MPSLKTFREMAGLPATIRRWAQAAKQVKETAVERDQAQNDLAIMKAEKAQTEEASTPEPQPQKAQGHVTPFDPDQHYLLPQIAHKCLLTPEEHPAFFARIQREMPEQYLMVEVPDWPPVPYAPLALIMQIGDGEGEAPWWESRFWTGVHPAIPTRQFHEWTNWEYDNRPEYNTNARGHAAAIGRQMAGPDLAPKRLAYMWQVPEFDPSEHTIIRSWIDRHGLDIASWWIDFWPQHRDDSAIVKVANPDAQREMDETGQWSPTRRAITRQYAHLLEQFRTGDQSVVAPPPPPPAPSPKPRPKQAPAPVLVFEDSQGQDQPVSAEVAQGCIIYEAREVADALEQLAGKRVRFFSGRPMDSAIVAMTRENIDRFLREDRTDRTQYIRDTGGRNTDCDDFGLRLRTQLQWSTGINGVGMIAGDTHAWTVFVVAEGPTPGLLMIEPQTDAVVDHLKGDYSVERRFEVLL